MTLNDYSAVCVLTEVAIGNRATKGDSAGGDGVICRHDARRNAAATFDVNKRTHETFLLESEFGALVDVVIQVIQVCASLRSHWLSPYLLFLYHSRKAS